MKGTLYTLLLLSSIFRAIITFPIYVYQMLQNLDASSRFMIDERKLGLLFWNTFRLSKKPLYSLSLYLKKLHPASDLLHFLHIFLRLLFVIINHRRILFTAPSYQFVRYFNALSCLSSLLLSLLIF